MPDRGWRTSGDGRALVVSGVWLETIGRHAIETPGYCWLDYVHEEDRERVEEEIAAHWAARRAYVVAFRALHHEGRIVWIRSGGMPQPDGGYVGWTYMARPEQRRPSGKVGSFGSFARSAGLLATALVVG
jgi:PAS domain S-box-containing protein